MADRTIAVDFIAKNDKFISPVDQMNKQMSKMATVADYAKKSLLTIAAAAAVVGVALLVPHKYMQALISDFQTGFSKLASLASTGAAAVGQRISSALGTGFGKIIKSQLSGLVSIPLAHLAIGGATVLGAGLAYAAKQAINFDAEMRNTNSVLNLNEGQFRKTSAAVLDISRKYPIAAASLAQALYRIASAGFTSAADSTTVLEKSALAATAGVTDVGTAGVAVTSVMKAYGLSAQDAGHVTDILFQSVKQGQFSFQDLAGNLSDFIGLAKNTGSTVEETFAAFSLMSLSIGDAAQSSTALRGVFSALINPSTDMTKVVHALGFETTTAMVKQLGLVQTVQALSAAVNGNVTAMGALFPDVRGLNGALALTATSADQAAQTVKNFTDQGRLSGAAQRAYAEQMKAAKVSVDQFLNVLKTTAIQIGTKIGRAHV